MSALAFGLGFGLALTWLWPLCMLFDSDSYYHLAIAREYARHGMLHDLPWARFSVMHHGFGDKELLFHLLLSPFSAGDNPLLGAKLAIALLVGGLCACLVRQAWPVLRYEAAYLPLLLLGGALSFDLRLIRLRPELLAVLLFLGAVAALTAERYVLLFVLSFAFALSYTAVHALLGLCGASFLYAWWRERRPSFPMVVSPGLGALLGLSLHPHFPHNLRIFYLQNVAFWRYRDQSDVGDEIHALGLVRFLQYDGAALLGFILLNAALARVESRADTPPAAARNYSIAALVFGLLFVTGARFSLYAWPFVLLAWAHLVARRGYGLSPRLVRFARNAQQAPRTWLVLSLLALLAAPRTIELLTHVADLGGCVWTPQLQQLQRLGRAVPPGAKIAAPWAAADDYVFFAPQGRYLNLLDPVFMRSAHPHLYRLQRALFRAELADVPLALVELDSEYLAFSDRSLPLLAAQLQHDPRFEPIIAHGHVLYRLVAQANRDFVLDYRVAAEREQLRAASARYPRAQQARTRAVEGIVDTGRLHLAGGCMWLEPLTDLAPGSSWELGSTAALTVYRGDQPLHTSPARSRLVLGEGTQLDLPRSPADEPIVLQLCSGAEPARFYLLRRGSAVTARF